MSCDSLLGHHSFASTQILQAAFFIVVLAVALPIWAQPDVSFVVNDLSDDGDANPGDGAALTAGGATTLRAAIQEVQALAVCGEITFEGSLFTAPATIALTAPIETSACVTIIGPGSDLLTVDAADQFRVFKFVHATVGLKGLSVARGVVTLDTGINGGGILSDDHSMLTMTECEVLDCTAEYGGGAVYSEDSSFAAERCSFRGNRAGEDNGAVGGAILMVGANQYATLLDCLLESNSSKNSGAALYVSGSNSQTLIVTTTIQNNAGIGAVYGRFCKMDIVDSTISGNSGSGTGAGIVGAIQTDIRIVGSTITGNTAAIGGSGIFVSQNSSLFLYNCTIINNVCRNTGPSTNWGGTIDTYEGVVTLGNTIVAKNIDRKNFAPDISATIISLGGNIIGNGKGGSGYSETEDLVGTDEAPIDPLLGPLADHGGLTLTMLPMSGSPAINGGKNELITPELFGDPAFDQRGEGFPRIQDGTVDIGATEVGPDVLPPVITLLGASPLPYECAAAYIDPGVTAFDEFDGDLSASVQITGTVDTATPGEYILTYNVSDAAGNPAIPVERTVVVSDTTPPIITLIGDATVILPCREPYVELGATTEDTCDTAIPAVSADSSGVDVNTAGSYEVTYTVSDAAGNAAEPVVRTVVVEGPCIPEIHTADQDGDQKINLTELLRIIQFFNSGGFHCADDPSSTEDGFVPGLGANTSCVHHSSDYFPSGPDWQVALTELLRIIQFFNSGGYHLCLDADPPTEDGYCPGP